MRLCGSRRESHTRYQSRFATNHDKRNPERLGKSRNRAVDGTVSRAIKAVFVHHYLEVRRSRYEISYPRNPAVETMIEYREVATLCYYHLLPRFST
jgi:hypothetical protein